MKQEEKQLLLKDLCARLPYGVKVTIELSKDKYTKVYDLREIDNDSTAKLRQQVTIWNYGFYSSVISYPLIDCRPYLRPMSSMTGEEKEEVKPLFSKFIDEFGKRVLVVRQNKMALYQDWLNEHHFDFRGLIPKGLAIKVTEENNPYKK